MDVFDRGSVPFIRTVDEQLRVNSFFITILTPDAEVHPETGEPTYKVGSDNVIFEAGAVFGRHGMNRLFFLWDMKTKPPTDLGLPGILCYSFDRAAANLEDEITRIAANIVRVIVEDGRNPELDDGRVRFLSLLKCRFGVQETVARELLRYSFEREVKEELNIRVEQCGVVWGEFDNYLLFSAPSERESTRWLKSFRHRFGTLINKVDSRLFYHDRYWRRPQPVDKTLEYKLVLLQPSTLRTSTTGAFRSRRNTRRHPRTFRSRMSPFCTAITM